MFISEINILNFRNIKKCSLNIDSNDIVLIGKNGQGKTNLLEVIYYLCYGSSFRTSNNNDLINNKEKFFFISFNYSDEKNILHNVSISYDGERKLIKMDNKEILDRRQIINNIPCIIFSHEDINLVRGELELKRKFFDQCITITDSFYINKLRNYKQILKQRNSIIKLGRNDLLNLYDEKFIEYGIELIEERNKICKRISDIVSDMYKIISKDNKNIKINYKPSWSLDLNKDDIKNKLVNQREAEQKFHTTISGPHRDKFIISDDLGLFINRASTGQIRLISLLLKTAQASYYKEKTKMQPLYLIDDVLLELDVEKRSDYLKLMGSYSQAFYTFLPNEKYFDEEMMKKKAKIYNVINGEYYE